jgi:hypothetical protein
MSAEQQLPRRPVRVVVYAVGWMLTVGLITFEMGRLDPLLHFLYEREELPRLPRIFWLFARLNSAAWSLPAILLLLCVLMVDELILHVLEGHRRAPFYSCLLFGLVLTAGVAINLLLVVALQLLPLAR